MGVRRYENLIFVKNILHGIISGSTREKIHPYEKSRWLLKL